MHAVATWNLGTISEFCLQTEENQGKMFLDDLPGAY
jgi:hypothetical protein